MCPDQLSCVTGRSRKWRKWANMYSTLSECLMRWSSSAKRSRTGEICWNMNSMSRSIRNSVNRLKHSLCAFPYSCVSVMASWNIMRRMSKPKGSVMVVICALECACVSVCACMIVLFCVCPLFSYLPFFVLVMTCEQHAVWCRQDGNSIRALG